MIKIAKIILILVVIGIVGYLYLTNSGNIKNWKTYNNDELGIEFLHPSAYKIAERAKKDLSYVLLYKDNVKYHPGNMSISDDSFSIAKKRGEVDYSDAEIVKIGNYTYYYKYDDFSFEGYHINFSYYLKDQDKDYFFSAGSSIRKSDTKNHPANIMARKILETIKFTE